MPPRPCAVLVTGAGSEDVNGLYVPSGKSWHEAEVFENDRHCMLSREPHQSRKTGITSYGWILGQDRKPMYAVQSEELLPPKSGWKKFSGLGPIPVLDLCFDQASAAEARRKLRGDADLSSIPRAFDAKDFNKNGFRAFEGYSEMRESSEHLPISELPYHKMGLPQEQLDLMDNFFKELRANKKQQAMSQKKELAEYELVKNEYREKALEEEALGKENPVKMLTDRKTNNQEETKTLKDDDLPSLVLTGPKKSQSAEKDILSDEDKKEIDELFMNFKPRERKSRLQKIIQEEEEDAEAANDRIMEELKRLKNTRRGEPTRFEQAAGELYCWWSLPAGILAKDINVDASNGGESLRVQVRNVVIFDRQLFHHIKGDDIIWSLDAGELSVTLTKRERSNLVLLI